MKLNRSIPLCDPSAHVWVVYPEPTSARFSAHKSTTGAAQPQISLDQLLRNATGLLLSRSAGCKVCGCTLLFCVWGLYLPQPDLRDLQGRVGSRTRACVFVHSGVVRILGINGDGRAERQRERDKVMHVYTVSMKQTDIMDWTTTHTQNNKLNK